MLKHLQKLLFLAALFCVPWVTQAQSLSDYTLTADTTTFTSIVSTGTAISLSSTDDGQGSCTLPFTFDFGESILNSGTTLSCSANGFINLGGTASGTYASYSTVSQRIINPMLNQDGHMGRSTGAGVFYQLDTVDGVQCFTIEYHLLGSYSTPYGAYSFQVKLYENGNIQFVYDTMNNGGSTRTLRTFIWDGTMGDLAAVSGEWATPTLGTTISTRPNAPVPANGLRYTFTRPVITCPKPGELAFFNIANDTASVSFHERGTATSWVLEYADSMFTPGAGYGTVVNLSDTVYQFTNLLPQTAYYVYVHSDCGSGDTSLNRFGTFRTPCVAYPHDSLPYTVDFENWATGSTGSAEEWVLGDPCWTFHTNYTSSYHYPYVSTTAHSGQRAMYMYKSGSSYYAYFCLPLFEDSINALEFSCYVYNSSSASASYGVQLGVMTNPMDVTSFELIETLYPSATSQWQKKEVILSDYTGNGGYLTLMMPTSISYGYTYVDDIVIREHRDCSVPANLAADATRADSVVVSWNTDGVTTDFELCYGAPGFNPDTMNVDNIVTGIYDSTYTLTDLNGGQAYDLYVRANCGSEYSYWAGPITVTPGSMNMSVSGTNTLYACGAVIYDDGGPTGNYSMNCNSTLYVYPSDSTMALVVSGVSYTESSFDYLRIYEGYGNTGTVIFDDYGVSATQTFGPYVTSGGPITIMFHSDGSEAYSGFQINLTCVNLPSCDRPENFQVTTLSSDSVSFSWSDPEGYEWYIQYGPTGFDPNDIDDTLGTTATFYETHGTITGLTPDSHYDFYLSSYCGSDTSLPQLISLHTPCVAYPTDSLPYHYGFEDAVSGTSGHINSCWTKGSRGVSTYYPYASTSYHAEGSKSLYFYGYSSTYFCWAAMPQFEAPITSLLVSFKLLKTSDTYGSLEVGVMTDPEDPSTFVTVQTVQPVSTSTWESFTVPLGNYTGTGTFIAFRQASTYYTYLDDITVDLMPTCPPVTNVEVPSVSTSSAFVTWRYMNGFPDVPSSYQVTVVDSTGTRVTDTTSNQYYMLTNLEPNSAYRVVVNSVCDGNVADADSAEFATSGFGCLVIDTTTIFNDTITGSNSTTNNYIPSYSFYNYGISQQIYRAEEFTTGGQISRISFKPSTVTQQRHFKVYLAHTSASSVSGSYLNPSDLVEVYDGTPTMTAGQWCELIFDTPFSYNGSDNLLVTFCDHTGSYVSGNYFYGHSVSGYTSMYSYGDGSTYHPSTASGGTTTNFRNDMVFYGFGCAQTSTCAEPLVRVVNVAADQVDLVWAPGADEAVWNVEHKAAGDANWTVDLTATTNTSHSFTSLTPNTTYQFRVYSICSNSDTFATVVSAKTPCVGQPIPFTEGFATWTTGTSGTAPDCWYKATSYSDNYYPYVSSGYSSDGDNRYMYMYSTNSSYSYLTLPAMDAPLDTLTITFALMRTNDSYNHEIQVGVMTDPEDFGTFQQVGSAIPQGTYQWNYFEFAFRGMTDGFITLVSPNGQYSYPYLDEIVVNYFNPCIRPYNIHTDNVTANSATIVWSDSAASNFEYEYGPAGFTRGTGTFGTSSTDTAYITGLTAGTPYTIYVRGLCSDTDTGNWSFSYNFNTQCGLLDAFPYTENFDGWGTGSSIHAPMCWTAGSDYSTSYPYITSTNHGGGTGGSMYMYNSTYSNPYSLTYFSMPELDTNVATVNQLQAVFYGYNSYTGYTHQVLVGACTSPGNMATFQVADTITIPNEWTLFEVPLDSITNGGRYITFASMPGGSSQYCYPYIDDVTIERIPTCQRPDSLVLDSVTTTTFTCHWHDRAGANEWIVEWGPRGFEPGTGTSFYTTSNPATVTGVPGSYNGDFYVYSICSVTDTGLNSRYPCPFNTLQVPATIPYNYNFEDSTEWANWQTNSNHATANWYRGTAKVYDSSYAMYMSNDGGLTFGTDNNAIVNAAAYRDIDFGTVDSSYEMTFRYWVGGDNAGRYDGLMVFLVDPNQPVIASNAAITSPWGNVNDLYRIADARRDTNWTEYHAIFDTISGVHRVAFFWLNQSRAAYFEWGPAAIDDIHIDYSTCPRPLNLDTAGVTSTSANLVWDGPSSASYRVCYRVVGADPSTNIYINCNTNHITLTGLSSMTSYRAWVQKICGDDSSLFSDGCTFQTELCDSPTYAQNFDSTSTTSTSYYFPGYATYNYSFSEVIIDSADLAAGGLVAGQTITAFMYNPTDMNANTYHTNCDIYMANTTATDLSNAFINVDSTFTQVADNMDLSFDAIGWQIRGFDAPFTWDGHSNVVFAVNRQHGSWTSGTSFESHYGRTGQGRYIYNDGSAYDPATVSGGYATDNIGNYRFISCGAPVSCAAPIITSVVQDYHSATITWTGDGNDYEVNIKETSALDWPATDIAVSGTTYTFTGLNPETDYTFRVRQDCNADSAGYSDWVIDAFTTDSLPCFAPDSLTVTDVTNAQGTFSWTVIGNESMWDIHVWTSGGLDSVYRVTTNPATVGGFTAGVTYNAAIRAVCGVEEFEGEYGETITFTTATCPDVTGLTSSNVTSSSVTLNWTADAMAESWMIEYGYTGFAQGTGTSATSNVNTFVVNGLEDETSYDFYVKAVCGDNWNSEGWTRVTATTLTGSGDTYTVTVNVNDASMGTATGGGTFHAGESCTVTATANDGYHFVNWSNGITDNPYTFTVVADVTLTANFAANGTEGIEDVAGDAICTIYPNPTSDATTISVSGVNGKVRISVVDMNGRTVASETLECNSDCEKTMDVDKLAQGAYFVKITGENVNMVKKLVVR